MTMVFFFLCCWAVCSLIQRIPHRKRRRFTTADRPQQRQTAQVYSPPPVTLYDVKKAERDRKERLKKDAARHDLPVLVDTLNDLDALMDAAQERYHNAAGSKETEKALRQIMTLRKQIAATESKIEKAKYIIKYGG